MRSALGKGLDALISKDALADVSASKAGPQGMQMVSIENIHPNPKQPRQTFSGDSISDLAESIKQKGILQPIIVSDKGLGHYEIIAGERRYRAALRAGMKEIPILIRQGSELEHFELSLIENLQREDLNPIDLAEGFKRLRDEFQMTQDDISRVVGKARPVVANTLRLLGLASDIQAAIRDGRITSGHAKALLAVDDEKAQRVLFDQILAEGLTVRHVESAARDHKQGKKSEHLRAAGYDDRPADIRTQEEELQSRLGRKVEIHAHPPTSHKGWMKLEFYSLDDFEALVQKLKG